MRNLLSFHIPDDALESYAMGRLPEESAAPLEEHLLICHECQDRLAETDQYIRAIRGAAGGLQDGKRRHRFSFFTDLFSWKPVAVGLAAVCLTVVAFVGVTGRQASPDYRDAYLRSERGPELTREPAVPAGHPLRLFLDSEGLEPHPEYRVEAVSVSGRPLSQVVARPGRDGLFATLDKPLPAGSYWVRVYTPDGSRLLREFPLALRPE